MRPSTVIGALGALLLAATLLVCGFGACCLPFTTDLLAQQVSQGADSPYTHEELVELACATRAYTVDPHESMDEATQSLAELVVSTARAASSDTAPKAVLWTHDARSALNDDTSALSTMEALADVSDRYALDASAVSHLGDCNRLINGALPWLLLIVVFTAAVAVLLLAFGRFSALALMLRLGPALLLVCLGVVGVWGVVDFNGLFAVFHSLFFAEGSWTFNYDSLLISMYPLPFWMGMGAVWLCVSLGASLLCLGLGYLGSRFAARREEVK